MRQKCKGTFILQSKEMRLNSKKNAKDLCCQLQAKTGQNEISVKILTENSAEQK